MRIYNKKGFISGLVTLVLCIVGMISIFIKGFSAGLGVLLIILFALAVAELSRSLSRPASLKDNAVENDERNQYILMKTAHRSMQILQGIGLAVTILLMVIYSATKSGLCLGAFILSCIYIAICFIVVLFTNIYYEKHE